MAIITTTIIIIGLMVGSTGITATTDIMAATMATTAMGITAIMEAITGTMAITVDIMVDIIGTSDVVIPAQAGIR
jgi:hypothetical protein